MIVEYRPRGLLLDAEDADELDDLEDLGDLYRSARWYRADNFHRHPGVSPARAAGDVVGACALVFLMAPLFGASVVVALAYPALTPLLLLATAMAGIILCVAAAGCLYGGAVDPSLTPASDRRAWGAGSPAGPTRRRTTSRRDWTEASSSAYNEHAGWYQARANAIDDMPLTRRPSRSGASGNRPRRPR